jgi:type II secretory pathway pseudopilin PulG
MIEIAICLAIIGFALIAIILALPFGLNAQRDNRQETIVGQDAAALIELIRTGARGNDDLTNYVYAITNYQVYYNNGLSAGVPNTLGWNNLVLTNGQRIVGLLSTPELADLSYRSTNNLYSGGYSNHIVAYVRSISGLAAEKPPQNNSLMVDDTFKYRLYVANAAVAQDTNTLSQTFNQNFSSSLRELRLSFRWPVLPNGAVANQGASPLTFRASVAGQIQHTYTNGLDLYFYQPQTFSALP